MTTYQTLKYTLYQKLALADPLWAQRSQCGWATQNIKKHLESANSAKAGCIVTL